MTEIVPPLIVGVVCALFGWIVGYWNGARGRAERWDRVPADVKLDE